MNMNVMMAAPPNGVPTVRSIDAPVPASDVESNGPISNRLADFNENPQDGDDFVDRACIWIINQIINFDKANVDKYQMTYQQYNENDAYVNIWADDPPTTQLIQRISFNVGIWNDAQYGRVARIYINGLYVNKKYSDVGSALLDILKAGLRSLVSLAQLNMGSVELYSVETAVLFYIKQGFMVRDLIAKKDPQNSVYSTQKILRFALEENNIEIMKKYAGVNQENFTEFIDYLVGSTKYGKFFKAYFDAREDSAEMEQAVMTSRFIASLFDTNMIFQFIRDPYKARVNLKPLTM